MKRINTFFSIKLNINLFIYFNIEMHCVEGPHFASLCRFKNKRTGNDFKSHKRLEVA